MRETRRAMRDRTPAVVLGIAVLLLLGLAGSGCDRGAEQETAERSAVPVFVSTVSVKQVVPALEFSGSVQAWREASVGAMISGQVKRMAVEVGDRVDAGDLMVEMSGEQLTQAKAQYLAMQKDWERMGRLLDKGAITQQAFDQADAGYQSARASYELVLESTHIRAPFAGVVTATYLEESEVFVLMPGGSSSSPAIVELVKMDTVKVEVEVAERDLSEVRPGLRATVEIGAYPGKSFAGTVRRVDPVLNPATLTATAEIVIPNGRELLRPGMFAGVSLELDPREILAIPHDGVVQQEGTGLYYAMRVEDGHAHRIDLELGHTYGDCLEVLGGVEAGESVVTMGRYRLPNGAAVRVKSEEGGR